MLVAPLRAADWEVPLAFHPVPEPLEGEIDKNPGSVATDDFPQVKLNTDDSGWLQNEEQCVIHPLDHQLRTAVWRDFRLGYRQVGIGVSQDGGATWTDRLLEPELQIYTRQSDPGLTWNSQGTVYLISLDFTFGGRNALAILASDDGGQSFEFRGVASDQHEDEYFEDKELMACDRSGGPWDGALHVVWTRFDYTGEGVETRIHHSRSLDGGLGWTDPLAVSDPGVQWPVPCVGAEGEVYIGWCSWWHGGIRFCRSIDGGVNFTGPWTIRPNTVFNDNLNGEVSTYSFPAMDVDLSGGAHHGRLHLLHMDMDYGDADVWYLYSDDGGDSWSPELRLNEDAPGNGADQFHPWLAVDDSGRVHAIWYDRRNDLPDNYLIDLYYRMSPDGGLSWGPEERVTESGFDPQAGTEGRAGLLGEYLGLAALGDEVQIVFTDTRDGDQDAWGSAFAVEGENQAPWARRCPDEDCGQVEDLDAFLEAFSGGDFGLDLADADGDTLLVEWHAGDSLFSEILALQPGDTVLCRPPCFDLNAFAEENIELYYTVSDGEHTVNENGADCVWALDFAAVERRDTAPRSPLPRITRIRPNPFNPSTRIEFELPAAGPVRLELRDLRGALVQVLQETRLPAGAHELSFSAEGLPSGLYFCVLQSGEFRSVHKVTLLK